MGLQRNALPKRTSATEHTHTDTHTQTRHTQPHTHRQTDRQTDTRTHTAQPPRRAQVQRAATTSRCRRRHQQQRWRRHTDTQTHTATHAHACAVRPSVRTHVRPHRDTVTRMPAQDTHSRLYVLLLFAHEHRLRTRHERDQAVRLGAEVMLREQPGDQPCAHGVFARDGLLSLGDVHGERRRAAAAAAAAGVPVLNEVRVSWSGVHAHPVPSA